ncbi:PTS mannose transporter subunit IID [Priestia megaterium]|uniref:PTS mannose transporter subunit IID n=1 Tax=Priestia megaterium TaxID=1404 RepID=UPI000BEB4278|nr:PTS mannose transporter subunit IID [Priestia megaterium]MED4064447.1 PTS mannose transporter subunit IID [Priestia megaterium]PEA38486.1 PTS mannose transporter subunit IID [Priestia megaterium]
MKKDIFTLLGGFLTALLFFFGTIGVSFEWFTTESINAFVIVVSAFAALVVNIYAVWKNTHVNMRIKQWLRKKESQKK